MAYAIVALLAIQAINYVLFKLDLMNLQNIFRSPAVTAVFASQLYFAVGEASGQLPRRNFLTGRTQIQQRDA
ncbi:hypothetical protein [Lysobacter fragariae]